MQFLEGKPKRETNHIGRLNIGLWFSLICYKSHHSYQNNRASDKQRDVSYMIREALEDLYNLLYTLTPTKNS